MKDQDKIVELLEKLVSFRTTSDNTKEKKKAIEFLENWLKKRNIRYRKFNHKKSPSILVNLPGKVKKKILLLSHLDVVSASDKKFKLKYDKRKKIAYGRGVIDNKGTAAILMLLAEKIKKYPERPTVQILFTTDEEIGGDDGAGRIVKMGIFDNVDAILVIDGGDEERIVVKEKGLIHLTFETFGKSAHGSNPWLGENAIEKAWEILDEIKSIFPPSDIDLEENWHSTVNVGIFSGGLAVNQVPDSARMSLDIRFTEKYYLDDLMEKIEKILENRAKILKINSGEVFSSDANNFGIKKYLEVMETMMDKKIRIGAEHGASDARHFSKLNVPIWLHYPKGGGLHSEDEWVDVSSLEKILYGIEKFLESFR